MEEPKFKVGDKIIINQNLINMPKGSIWTITRISQIGVKVKEIELSIWLEYRKFDKLTKLHKVLS